MRAVVHQGDRKAGVVGDRPLPELRPGYLLVKVKAVAVNPTDWKHQQYIHIPGHVAGCDYAGVVEKTGEGYETKWKVGDRIAGMVNGINKLHEENGAFAGCVVAKADVQFKIPDYMSFEEAATLGVGSMTCGQGLFQALELQVPDNPTKNVGVVLVHGGSTATGTLGLQYLKLAGYTPITTCSPQNFDLVKSLGAAEVFDYNDPECVEKIKSYTHDNLRTVWDTISSPESTALCSAVLASGGQYACLGPTKLDREDVKFHMTVAYTVLGELVDRSPAFKIEANPADFEHAKKIRSVTQELLDQKKLKPHPVQVGDSGLDVVVDGMELLRQNKVSGMKLVYSLP